MKMRMIIAFILLICLSTQISAQFTPPLDMAEARQLCDSRPLVPIEGIWHFNDMNLEVLILSEENNTDSFGIWVVESDNLLISSGVKIGTLKSSSDPNKFQFSIFTNLKKGVFSDPRKCIATFSEKNESLSLEKNSLNFRFNPIPLITKKFRSVLRISEDNPSRRLKDGMIHIYPSYDGNGSSRRKPRYL